MRKSVEHYLLIAWFLASAAVLVELLWLSGRQFCWLQELPEAPAQMMLGLPVIPAGLMFFLIIPKAIVSERWGRATVAGFSGLVLIFFAVQLGQWSMIDRLPWETKCAAIKGQYPPIY